MKKTVWTFLVSLVCLCLVLWTLLPSVPHSPKFMQTMQEHAQMIEGHGHSHGLVEDILWALHGHSHDAADHEHSQMVFAPGNSSQPMHTFREAWRPQLSRRSPSQVFRIERPPRV